MKTALPTSMKRSDITATKHPVNGAWVLSALVDGYLKTRTYYGYTKREAINAFLSDPA